MVVGVVVEVEGLECIAVGVGVELDTLAEDVTNVTTTDNKNKYATVTTPITNKEIFITKYCYSTIRIRYRYIFCLKKEGLANLLFLFVVKI